MITLLLHLIELSAGLSWLLVSTSVQRSEKTERIVIRKTGSFFSTVKFCFDEITIKIDTWKISFSFKNYR